jgi:putative methionine-R-sulfoxide reductase with GAF domain
MVPMDRVSRVIFDYAAQIGAAQDLDALLELNAGMARDLVGADRCSIWLVDNKHRRLWTKVAHGVRELHVPIGQGLVGAALTRNEAILVNDTSQDQRFLRSVDIESGYVTKSVLTLPLHGVDGKPIGALQVLNKPGGFSPEDVDLLGLCSAYWKRSGSARKRRWRSLSFAKWKSRGMSSSTCCRRSVRRFQDCNTRAIAARPNSWAATITISCPCPTADCYLL